MRSTPAAHDLRGDCGLRDDRQVRSAGAGHYNARHRLGVHPPVHRDRTRRRVVDSVGRPLADRRVRLRPRLRHEQPVRAPQDRRGDRRDLLRGLAQAVDDLGKALAQRAVMVEPGEVKVLVRQRGQPGHRFVLAHPAVLDVFQELSQPLLVDDAPAFVGSRAPARAVVPDLRVRVSAIISFVVLFTDYMPSLRRSTSVRRGKERTRQPHFNLSGLPAGDMGRAPLHCGKADGR